MFKNSKQGRQVASAFLAFTMLFSIPTFVSAKSSKVAKKTVSTVKVPKICVNGLASSYTSKQSPSFKVWSTGYNKTVQYKVLLINQQSKKTLNVTKGYTKPYSYKTQVSYKLSKLSTGKYKVYVYVKRANSKVSYDSYIAKNIAVNNTVSNLPSKADLQILATSDTHGRFMPYDYAINTVDTTGSLAQVATAVKAARTSNPNNTVLVDAGDIIQDNSADLFLNDTIHPMIAAMNAMKYDAIELGNHEFNYGIPTLKKVMSKSTSTVLCANLYEKDQKTRIFAPYKIVTTKGGVKVGLIGIVTPNITQWDAENLKGYKVTDPLVEVQNAIKQLKGKVDVMVGVFHESETPEYGTPNSGADEIAAKCPELTAIIAAHEHKQVDHKVYSNKVVLVENKSGAATLATVNIKLVNKAGKYTVANRDTDVTSKVNLMKDAKNNIEVQPDANLSKILAPFDQKAKDDANKVIGKLVGGDLVPADEVTGIPTAQIQETAMINLINQVQMYYSGAEVSAAAAFSPTANIKAGDIKKCGTAAIYKYNNTLYLMEMTGKQLKQYMEWSASYYNQYKDGDLTLSFNPDIRAYNYDMFNGVKYEVNVSKPAGQRIENLTRMNGTPIKDTDTLKVAVNNYRASSQLTNFTGGVYKTGDTLPKVLEKDMVKGTPVRDLIGKYIQEVKGGTIKPEVEGNWKVTGNNWNADLRSKAVKLINAGTIKIPASADGRTPNVAPVTTKDVQSISMILVNRMAA